MGFTIKNGKVEKIKLPSHIPSSIIHKVDNNTKAKNKVKELLKLYDKVSKDVVYNY